jgi:hypothetical protein
MDYEYSVTITNDGDANPDWIGRYDNALEAVTVFASCIDYGFAKEYRTINLSEPSGKMHTKILYRSGIVGGK